MRSVIVARSAAEYLRVAANRGMTGAIVCAIVLCGVRSHAQDGPLPALNVSISKIEFDPKTVAIGARGALQGGCGGVIVLIKARRDGICEFEYRTDGCGGVHTDYRLRVPMDGGLVTISRENGSFKNSFGDDAKKLIRSGGPNGFLEVVEVAGEDVVVKPLTHASEMYPAKGDTVRFRFRFYTDVAQTKEDQTIAFNQSESFVVGSEKMWPWVAAVMKDMSVGDCWQVEVPTKIADGASKWLGQAKPGKVLYVQLRMVGLERGK